MTTNEKRITFAGLLLLWWFSRPALTPAQRETTAGGDNVLRAPIEDVNVVVGAPTIYGDPGVTLSRGGSSPEWPDWGGPIQDPWGRPDWGGGGNMDNFFQMM